jgi:hypothetical protein
MWRLGSWGVRRSTGCPSTGAKAAVAAALGEKYERLSTLPSGPGILVGELPGLVGLEAAVRDLLGRSRFVAW